MLAVGISIVRHGALPKWLGWVAILFGVAGMTPAGFFAFIGAGLWIGVASILLPLRARSGLPAAWAPGNGPAGAACLAALRLLNDGRVALDSGAQLGHRRSVAPDAVCSAFGEGP